MLTPNRDSKISGGRESALLTRLGYLFLVFIISLVCVYDNILNICFAQELPSTEQNPLCRLIIHYGGVKQLIIIKSYCTVIGISMLLLLVYTKFRVCVKIMFALSIMLFFYLTFYCSTGDYNINTIIMENVTYKGTLSSFFDFYLTDTFKEKVDRLIVR